MVNKKQKEESNCNDKNCPVHGSLKTSTKSFTGTVISDKMHKSATIAFERIVKVAKYERYEKQKTKIKVHNPPCINAKTGELVKVFQCRPLSKTINFVIVEKYGKGQIFHTRNEDLTVETKEEEKGHKKDKKETE